VLLKRERRTEVRRRFTDAQVNALQRISWWDWPMTTIRDAVPMLS
jgi:DNA-binding transcriptional MerR regulator